MSSPVRIPADVDRPDRLVAGLTGRQLVILAGAALLLYVLWAATRTLVPLPMFLVVATPVGGAAAALALGRRDGMSLDRLVLAAMRQRLQPHHRVAAPEGLRPVPDWIAQHATYATTADGPHRPRVRSGLDPAALRLPAEGITDTGMVNLGQDGIAAVAVAGTVNFGLRTPAEQDALIATFARWLHSLTSPVQIVIRAERLDLSGQIGELYDAAPALPHPALEHAAREHAGYLSQLADGADLLRRQVLLILREPLRGPTHNAAPGLPSVRRSARARRRPLEQPAHDAQRRAAESRLIRRLAEAVDLLAPAGIVVTPLDAGQATAVLAAACNPDSIVPPSAGVAGADDVITTEPDPLGTGTAHGWPGEDRGAPEPAGQRWPEGLGGAGPGRDEHWSAWPDDEYSTESSTHTRSGSDGSDGGSDGDSERYPLRDDRELGDWEVEW